MILEPKDKNMMEENDCTYCPFCGERMIWVSDENSSDHGIGGEERIVKVYECTNCDCQGTFVQESEKYYKE